MRTWMLFITSAAIAVVAGCATERELSFPPVDDEIAEIGLYDYEIPEACRCNSTECLEQALADAGHYNLCVTFFCGVDDLRHACHLCDDANGDPAEMIDPVATRIP
jgi:hypothetical protein